MEKTNLDPAIDAEIRDTIEHAKSFAIKQFSGKPHCVNPNNALEHATGIYISRCGKAMEGSKFYSRSEHESGVLNFLGAFASNQEFNNLMRLLPQLINNVEVYFPRYQQCLMEIFFKHCSKDSKSDIKTDGIACLTKHWFDYYDDDRPTWSMIG